MTTFALNQAPTEQAPQSFVELVTSSARTGTGSDLWATPWSVVASATKAAGLAMPHLDIAAVAATAKAPRYCGPDSKHEGWRNGLSAQVGTGAHRIAWCNPPWSDVRPWLARCEALARDGWHVLALVPLRPSTRAWRRYVWEGTASTVLCADRRVAFEIEGKPGSSCPHDVAAVHWFAYAKTHVCTPKWRLWEVAPTSADNAQTEMDIE